MFLIRSLLFFRLLLPYLFSFYVAAGFYAGEFFDPFHKLAPGKKAVYGLAPVLHAFYFYAGGNVLDINAGCGLIHLLSALARRSYEFLLNILFEDTERFHLIPKPFILLFAYSKSNHVKL